MKKKLIYTMLCSVIMFSGTLRASDNEKREEDIEARIDAEAKKKQLEILQSAPKTPLLQKQIETEHVDDTPSTKRISVRVKLQKARRERDNSVARELEEITRDTAIKKLELAKKQEEEKRKEDQIKREILLEQYARIIDQEKETATKKQEENEALGTQVASLERKVLELGEQYKRKTAMLEDATFAELDEISEELHKKTKELTETKQKLWKAEAEAEIVKLQISTHQQAKETLEAKFQQIMEGKEVSKDVSSKKESSNSPKGTPIPSKGTSDSKDEKSEKSEKSDQNLDDPFDVNF